MAIALCEHIKDNGSTCGSPALTGYSFCFFHQRLRLPRHRPSDFEYKLPILDTPHSILMAIQHVTQAALDGLLEERRARLVLSALRLAQTTIKEMQKVDAEQDVRASQVTAPVLSSRAPLLGEGSASCPNYHDSLPAAAAAPEGSPRREPWVRGEAGLHTLPTDRGRAELQLRVADSEKVGALAPVPAAAAASEGSPWREPWVSVTSTPKAPAGATDKKPPLSAHQLKLMKKIIRRGPSHPQFKLAARLLDHHISDTA